MRVLLLLLAFTLAACAEGGLNTVEVTETESRTLTLDGRELAFDGFAGNVSVVAVPNLDVTEVEFTKRARGATESQANARLGAIRLNESGDDALYQYVWRTDDDGEASVDADVRVPLTANVVVIVESGEITANGLSGPFTAETGAGEIRAEHLRSARVRLQSGAGGITAGAAFIPREGDWRIESGSGDVTLRLPPTASVRVEAESGAGSLDLDPQLTFANVRQSGGPAGVDFRARLGEGDARVRATTGAGDVEVLRYTPPAPESEAARETAPVLPDTTRPDSVGADA